MKANMKINSTDKSLEKWQLLAVMFKKIWYNHSRLQFIREGFLGFLDTNEDICRLTTTEFISDPINNGFILVVPQITAS